MVKKTGLGKGLDALFSMPTETTSVPVEEQQREGDVLRNLRLIDVEPNRTQPRKRFDLESLQELAESIKTYGIIQPILVTEKEGFFEIIAGERRWRAAKLAGLNEIPAIIRDDNEKKNKEIALVENVQREDLNPIEKAEGIKSLIDEYHLTHDEIGKMLGMGRSSVSNNLRLLNLEPRVLDLVKEGKILEGHARSLLVITDPDEQYKAAIRLIEKNQTVRDIEKKVNRTKKEEYDPRKEVMYRDIEDTFQGFFGTKVKVDPGKRSGKIVIQYRTNSDLERILGLLK